MGLLSGHDGIAGEIGGSVETVKSDSRHGSCEFHRDLHVVVVEDGQGATRHGHSIDHSVERQCSCQSPLNGQARANSEGLRR